MVVYLGNMSGKSKTSGNQYYRYTLLEVKAENGDGSKLSGRVHEFFADSEIDVSKLECGDVVRAKFVDRGELDERKTLINIEKLEDSPFRALI